MEDPSYVTSTVKPGGVVVAVTDLGVPSYLWLVLVMFTVAVALVIVMVVESELP